jgi:sterol desaturase/sphingolipid hydroxylase (fatty acid hydroxylase superfamily)
MNDFLISFFNVVGIIVLWSFVLYWIHRACHSFRPLKRFHRDHHREVIVHPDKKWHWNNLLLYNDTRDSTIDLWITEVIPTVAIAWLFGAPWLFVGYYLWAALFQESLEHNSRISIRPFSAGRWHLLHHRHPDKNYGFPFRMWDKVFRTNEEPGQS